MKASETNFLKFLQGSKQFIIPIYQRKYSWTIDQCKKLWSDIVRAASDEDIQGHFVGSVVYIEKGLYQITAVPQLLVIDGQQRMTTLTLLLLALGKAIEDSGQKYEITKKKIMNRYLVNNDEDDELYHKLLLTETDKDTLLNLIDGNEIPNSFSKIIFENYQFFVGMIKGSDIDAHLLYEGLSKLIIVDISLDREHDNPQLIFESLNSTGLDLSQADLIRNYVLMKLETKEQERLYKTYWYRMEQSFSDKNESTFFDRFMRDYLTVKTGNIPNIRNVYTAFKEYTVKKESISIESLLSDIYQYSKYFVAIAFQNEKDKEIHEVIKDIDALKVDVSYPFLLEVYDDYHKDLLSKEDFISILKLVESYVFRRAICGVPTNSMNRTFANLSSEIDKKNYLESVKTAFIMKNTYKRFPIDDEFKRELVVKDVYNFRSRNYLLRKLENYKRKEIVNIDSYTIEHIMPQNENLSPDWQNDLGPDWETIHQTYLHTIGNLTLTGYNSELSDRPYNVKRDMEGGYADSPLRLNRIIGKLDTWNKQEIESRANRLADLATSVWSYPIVPKDVITEYKEKADQKNATNYSIENFPELSGDMLDLFNLLRNRILNLDSSVREEFKKLYIAYKTSTNFVDIVPQKSKLKLSLNLQFTEIHDPNGICNDITNKGSWGNGDVEFGVSNATELEYAIFLINQSFEKHQDDE